MRLWCLCLVGALSRVLMGDEVELHSGDRLLGTVVEQTADSVVLDHPALGRLVTNAEWVLQIDKVDGVNFKLGLAHEYQSLTDPGVDHNDLSIYGALVIDF